MYFPFKFRSLGGVNAKKFPLRGGVYGNKDQRKSFFFRRPSVRKSHTKLEARADIGNYARGARILNDVVFGAFDDETDGQFDEAVEDREDDCAVIAEMAVDDGAPTMSPLDL